MIIDSAAIEGAARQLILVGDLSGAEWLLSESLGSDPECGTIYALFALIEHNRKNHRTAILLAEQSLSFELNAEALRVKAVSLLDLKKPRRAVAAAQAAHKVDPRDVRNAAILGFVLARAGRLRAALVAYEHACHLAPSEPGLRGDLGLLYYCNRDVVRARNIAETIHSSCEVASVLILRGELLLERRRFNEARAFANRVLRRNPTSRPAISLLVDIRTANYRLFARGGIVREALSRSPKSVQVALIVVGILAIGAEPIFASIFLAAVAIYLMLGAVVASIMLRCEIRALKCGRAC